MRRWIPIPALAAAMALAGCGTEPEPAVLGATLTRPAATAPSSAPTSLVVRAPQASTVTTPATTVPAPEDIAAATEARITYPYRAVLDDWTISFEGDHDDVRGLTFPDRRRIEIYVGDGDTPAGLSRVLAHEIGHALDITLNDDADRAAWRAARGIPDTTPWWPSDTVFDFDTGSGDWAEAFAVWQTGATNQSSVAGPLTAEHLALLESLLR